MNQGSSIVFTQTRFAKNQDRLPIVSSIVDLLAQAFGVAAGTDDAAPDAGYEVRPQGNLAFFLKVELGGNLGEF